MKSSCRRFLFEKKLVWNPKFFKCKKKKFFFVIKIVKFINDKFFRSKFLDTLRINFFYLFFIKHDLFLHMYQMKL